MYNETVILKNKIDALNNEISRLLEDNIRLQEISQIIRIPDFTSEFKIQLISRILKNEVTVKGDVKW